MYNEYLETSLSKTDYGWLFYQVIEPGVSNSARLWDKAWLWDRSIMGDKSKGFRVK